MANPREVRVIDGVEYPRHPTWQVGALPEATRLRQMLAAVNFARTRCTTRERPLHQSLVDAEATILRSLTAASPTPPKLDQTPIWET